MVVSFPNYIGFKIKLRIWYQPSIAVGITFQIGWYYLDCLNKEISSGGSSLYLDEKEV